MRPRSSASKCPRATSSTSTTFSPVSTKAGILPRAASTMMRPVGVGRTSRGADRRRRIDDHGRQPVVRDHALDQPLGQHLAALVGADGLVRWPAAHLRLPPRSPVRRAGSPRCWCRPRARRCRASAARITAARALEVVALDLSRVARPQPVVGRHVEQVAHAVERPDRRLAWSRMSPSTTSASRSGQVAPRTAGAHQHAHLRSRAAARRAPPPSRRSRLRLSPVPGPALPCRIFLSFALMRKPHQAYPCCAAWRKFLTSAEG